MKSNLSGKKGRGASFRALVAFSLDDWNRNGMTTIEAEKKTKVEKRGKIPGRNLKSEPVSGDRFLQGLRGQVEESVWKIQ